jgi:hypothetical protein
MGWLTGAAATGGEGAGRLRGFSVTTQDFIKFWGKFSFLFSLCCLEIHRDLKLFESI